MNLREIGAAAAGALLCAAATLATSSDGAAAAAGPTFLTYVDAPPAGVPLDHLPHLLASFGGSFRRMTMDTGSTGIAVFAGSIPHWRSLPNLGPATLTYGSSGRILVGFKVLVPVTIAGGNGASVTTEPIPVLAVTRIDCTPNARDCRPVSRPYHTAMMGIGYGHGRPGKVETGPSGNPFVRVEGQGDSRGAASRPGYIATARGIQVGLAPGDIDRFALVKLGRQSSSEWALPTACVAVDGRKAGCGPLSVDTGIVNMLIAAPGGTSAREIAVDVGSATKPAAHYTFSPGDGSPMTPRAIQTVPPGSPVFVNTGVHFLNGYDVLYDPLLGYAGYRPAGG